MTTETKEPRDLARDTGKTIICKVLGPMVGVYYPYKRTGDLYVVGPGDLEGNSHCCQCDADFPTKEFISHVNKHNSRLRKYPDLIIDHSLVKQGAGE